MKFILAILILSLMLSGCDSEPAEKPLPPVVKIIQVNQSANFQNDSYAGIVCGRYESNLAFQTGGRILNRTVEEGNFVRAGEILMELDPKDAVQQLNASNAQVDSARANLNLAKSNFERYNQLFKENAISAAMLDQYRTNYESAVATYNAAVAQAAQLSNNLSYTQLTANADGVISKISAEIGQVVAAGQTVLTLTQTNELEVEINVPENKLSEIEIGKRCEISFWANDDKVGGVVREIAPVADSAARTYRVRISILNLREGIYLGMTASADFISSNKNSGSYILPLSAIYQTGTQAQVWIVTNENKTTLKNVEVESFSGNEVIVRGISLNDKVVAAGVHKLREGQEVRIKD
mgnify:CR=1 FL=1